MDRLARTVREQVALGRLLPLGTPDDNAWMTERAAVRALRWTTAGLSGVRLGGVSLALAESGGEAPESGPVGALPHLPVRIEASFEATADEPLPQAADRLRDVLWTTARDGLGIAVTEVDLQVTGLLDGDDAPVSELAGAEDAEPDGDEAPVPLDPSGLAEAVATAALTVPGVVRLSRRPVGLGSGVRIQDTAAGSAGDSAGSDEAPGRSVQVQIAVSPGHRPLEVARSVAAAVAVAAAEGAPGPVRTAVVVTDAG
ncbi:nucleopolyhedrovirus P10 family protein [Streptomyces sp. NPDC008139]|uniref:nucleopolyhedrovirus P10 family protein n=1 Tax=Streptomyces sp. NPDC008139 TaxID=3364814 RepID=UPI0036EE87D4